MLFEGNRYRITRGTIDFLNPNGIEPFFDIEAEARIRRAVEIFSRVLGEDTGRVATASVNEGEILTALGRFDAAEAAIQKALGIWRAQKASSFLIGYGLLDEGKLQLARRDPRAAAASLEESLALWERGEHLAAVCQRWLDAARTRLDGDSPT